MTEQAKMQTELKPCPFCGGKPHFANYAEPKDKTPVLRLECGNPHCEMLVATPPGPPSCKELMIQAWNTRAALAATEGE